MKTRIARSSQVFWIAATIGFAFAILLAMPGNGLAQGSWTVSPSPTPTNNIYYNAGNVGIGTNAPAERLVVSNNSASLPAGLSGTTLHIGGADGSNNRFTSDAFGGANIFNYRRANNTATSPSALAPDDLIGQFSWLGFGSTAYSTARAAIAANASQTWTDANQGTYLTFFTTLNNTAAPLERMRIDNAGNVGIGTTSPTAILHIQGSGTSGYRGIQVQNSFTDAETKGAIAIIGARKTNANVPFSGFGTWDNGTSRTVYIGGGQWSIPDANAIKFYTASTYDESNGVSGNTRMLIDSSGNVGIGTSPAAGNKLDVAGTINATGLVVNGAAVTGGGPVSVFTRTGAVVAATNDYTWAQINKTTSSLADLTTASAGDLSSGTIAVARLGSSGTANATTFLRGDNTWAVPSGGSQWNNGGSSSISYSSGNVGIGTTTAPSDTLEVNGNLKVSGSGNITAAGTIEGYNLKAKFQDVAEWVPSSERILAGTVVVLDTIKSNQVISSTQAYDTRVAGVVSEQPGIALGESGDGKVLVATTGRVLVKVDASHGPIHIGDLLVTSDISGVAMKSEPIAVGGRLLHMPGTLIGKALEPLEKGSGKILVLLSLQ